MIYLVAFSLAFTLAVILTLVVKKLALKLDIVDRPNSERKIHKKPIPLLGGVAVFFSFTLLLAYYSFFTNYIIHDFIQAKFIVGIIIAALLITIGGVLDDKYNLKSRIQIIFPITAVLVIIFCGIGITHIRNPFGGIISFNNWEFVVLYWQGLPYKITFMEDIFTFIWLMVMMYTTKLLDGLDGLVSGVSAIGALVIFGICLSPLVAQSNTGILAILLAGTFCGFLVFNWNPARIFLGESGALFAGLMLGVLSIISGSKVATTLLIMGIPLLDVVWVILRRIRNGQNPFKFADRKHLHFRLLDVGLSQRQAVLVIYGLTALFGGLAIFLQSFGKLIALVALAIVMIILACLLVFVYQRKPDKNE